MEPKSEMIHVRISPRYKEYLLRLAIRAKYNSIGQYINSVIFFETMGMIQEMAWEEAKRVASKAVGIPETVGLTLDNKNAESVLGAERAIKFFDVVIKEQPKAVEKIKAELQFVDNDFDYIIGD